MRCRHAIVLLLVFSALSTSAQQSSVLNDGTWVRLGIVETGVYKLEFNDLQSYNLNPSSIDPANISMYGDGGKTLNQVLGPGTPLDLNEIAIHVEGEDDGSFDQGDFILFYAETPESVVLNDQTGFFEISSNLYAADTSYYYLQVGSNTGKRPGDTADLGGSNPIVDSYEDWRFIEDFKTNRVGSGREWFGDKFDAGTLSRSYTWTITGVKAGSEIRILPVFMAYSFVSTRFNTFLNGLQVGAENIPAVSDSKYGDKGYVVAADYSINADLINEDELEVDLVFEPAQSSSVSLGYLDKLVLQVRRDLNMESDFMVFQSLLSLDQSISEFEVSTSAANPVIWDITDPSNALNQQFQSNQGTLTFNASSTDLKRYVVVDKDGPLLKPEFFTSLDNQDIKGSEAPHFIIVTAPEFLTEAERLANHRRQHNNLDVLVVTTDDLFIEFAHSVRDPSAIRNMAYYFYNRSDAPQKLQSLLLIGRGSYDVRNFLRRGLNFVPIYQSRESLDPLRTYGSDDYYGFLEDGEGEWAEDSGGNHDMEIAVGRLPVKTLSEAAQVVDKLIYYDTSTETFGDWRSKMLFVADDGDFNIHTSQSDQLTVFVDTTFERFNPIKLYLDDFEQEPRAGGEKSPKMTEAINRAIDEGALIVNFTGHGGEAGWTQEFILDQFIVEEWENRDRLPLLVTATCEFGRHDNPARISSGELTLLNPNGGSIGLVSTSRPVFSSTNFQLNKAFYEAVYDDSQDQITLGEIFRVTKNNSVSGVFNRNFSLLGDPSMVLLYPKHKIQIDEVNQLSVDLADTLGALGMVQLKGSIVDYQENLITGFNGVVDITFYDKKRWVTTLGDENPPFNYRDWNSRLFNGKATVANGEFTVDFMLPRNMIYTIGQGKVSMYAFDEINNVDATGTELDIKVGGEEDGIVSDNIPPEIELFMNDESFLDGSIVPEDSRLIVKLFDNSGINISGVGVGQQLEAVLDGTEVFNLNEYYTAELDNFTRGTVAFDLFDLAEGSHNLKVKAFDNNNNFSESEINFVVSKDNGIRVHRVLGAPNPFSENTVISVEHSRPGDDLEVGLTIYNRMGKLLVNENYLVEDSPIRIELKDWNGIGASGENIEQGIYIVRVSLRSLSDGTKNRGYAKLINLK